jgi:hypothetical protein
MLVRPALPCPPTVAAWPFVKDGRRAGFGQLSNSFPQAVPVAVSDSREDPGHSGGKSV